MTEGSEVPLTDFQIQQLAANRKADRTDNYKAKIVQGSLPLYTPPASKLSRVDATYLSPTDIEARDFVAERGIKRGFKQLGTSISRVLRNNTKNSPR